MSFLIFALGFVVGTFIAGAIVWRTAPIQPTSKMCGDSCCTGRSDPRCAAGNCTYHCQASIGCGGRCLNEWTKAKQREIAGRPFFIDPSRGARA